jgi:hypothetical protein
MKWLEGLKEYWQCRNEAIMHTFDSSLFDSSEHKAIDRKKQKLKERKAEIVHTTTQGHLISNHTYDSYQQIRYLLHQQYFVKQAEDFYIEEAAEEREALFKSGKLQKDYIIGNEGNSWEELKQERPKDDYHPLKGVYYNRLAAVKYAEQWWNSYNPKFRHFDVDCTNFVSQCLYAGGLPMSGSPNRSKGWWYQNSQWSFSWAVAHSLRWHLSGSSSGLRGKEAASAEELQVGDVICYDFDGDGRWQHTTFVVAKDKNEMPLVNAHTTNSRMRYWEYEDSTAWTPNIKYKFFRIVDDYS